MSKKRCDICNAELSACGEMTSDGPRMDCRQCLMVCKIQRLQARIADLESIVSRLPPPTADNITLIPGLDIGYRHKPNGAIGFGSPQWSPNRQEWMIHLGDRKWARVIECYSTRAAAETARDKEQEKTR